MKKPGFKGKMLKEKMEKEKMSNSIFRISRDAPTGVSIRARN